jgi:hypothetical protein
MAARLSGLPCWPARAALTVMLLGVGCARSEVDLPADPPDALVLSAADAPVEDVTPDDVLPDVADTIDDVDSAPDLPLLPFCGDGVVDDDEQCDEGDGNGRDEPGACRADCTLPECGDGVLDPGELCDDGPLNSDTEPDACRTSCQPAVCGDGVLDEGEECDDPEKPGFEGCGIDCRLPAIPCTPCRFNEDCGRQVDRCTPLLDGSFCTTGCDTEEDCPPDFTCRPVAGQSFGQCIPPEEVCTPCLDRDGDGYGIGLECLGFDCDDTNPAINPGATEICDDIDNNCNGLNDEGCPPDLIVDGETVSLAGSFLFDRVEVRNGGVLQVTPFEGTPGVPGSDANGCLDIEARIVVVRDTGTIDAVGAGGAGDGTGRDGGFGRNLENTGPAGGSYGGIGGSGPGLFPSPAYGTPDGPDIEQGSHGGSFRIVAIGLGPACDILEGRVSAGGLGGGCFRARAPDIDIAGRILADGTPGQSASRSLETTIVDGAGGGSGGGILLDGRRVVIRDGAVLSANGAPGGRGGTFQLSNELEQCIGNGGGGGGGGRIKIFGGTTLRGRLTTNGGAGAEGPQSNANSGRPGTVITR